MSQFPATIQHRKKMIPFLEKCLADENCVVLYQDESSFHVNLNEPKAYVDADQPAVDTFLNSGKGPGKIASQLFTTNPFP
jgi:hypothetical protein